MNKCLYCYKSLIGEGDFHEKCSKAFFGTAISPEIPYSLDEMSELAKTIVERSISVPGVQPKLSMTYVNDARKKDYRLTVVGALGGNYIFKPPNEKFQEMPENEHLTMRTAELLGLNVVPSSLIRLKSGELGYITKRVDRTESGDKIHMLDMFQITEGFDKYKSSMEKIAKALTKYSSNPLLDKLFLFELTIFSFITGNSDMHLKNFSMLNQNDKWVLAPAYDLLSVKLILPEDKEELALSLKGKKQKLTRADFDQFGLDIGLNQKQINGVFNRFNRNLKNIDLLIKSSFLSEEFQKKYFAIVQKQYSKIFH
ncbi:MAG: HipA domain-containing protein [Salinivirgaceae bacterium]|nr:HipA domain-containing protein [Salinivirgaceae bacterium]